MRLNYLNESLKTALCAVGSLLLGVVPAVAQQQINLTAGPASVSLPDGSSVPMWGYSCGGVVTGSTATCAALSPKAGWSPVVITVPTGQDLTINLTNSLSFSNGNSVPTSLMIVGQLGGGLGTPGGFTPPPDHSNAQSNVTWPIANTGGGTGTPPTQGPRVQSFGTEVAVGATTALTWKAPRPGTYLIESGTHPSIQGSMGLYGILVVTTAPVGTTAGTAYTGVTYNAEVPLLFSEIDPVQNKAVNTAVNSVGFSETTVWSGQPGGCGYPGSPTYGTCYPPVVNYAPPLLLDQWGCVRQD
jgi:FtsP/CotA-like multicopper oxidase with cupredoxin domain